MIQGKTKFFALLLLVAVMVSAGTARAEEPCDCPEVWKDTTAPMHDRIMNLLSLMTVEEKVALMTHNAPAIPRLGIDKYYHGNEALHGVVRPGRFTVFPQAIALSATWNPELIHGVATAISDEARGKWVKLNLGKNQTQGSSDLLSFWSPTINMARDPRWGRTPETYGEDPFLTSQIGVAFVKGIQGDHPKYLKATSCPKHFAANNEEHNRSHCNAVISERDLREYYLPAFEKCIIDGKAQSIMTAYNAVNGVPCVVNNYLTKKVLRDDWGFQGYIVTDCSAPQWMVTEHKYVRDHDTAAVLMMKAGIDIECAHDVYCEPLLRAYKDFRVTDAEIDSAAYHILRGRMLLGLFDDPNDNPYNSISPDVVGCREHQELALETARQSIVLLKNNKNFLPLNAKKIKSIAVVGPNADTYEFGDYSGSPVNPPVNMLEGIRSHVGSNVKVVHAPWVSSATGNEPIRKNFLPNGLKAEYFSNPDLKGTPAVRTEDEVYYDPVNRPPDPFLPVGPMSARWSGPLAPTVSGDYIFNMRSDDGCRVYLDGKLIIDAWTSHPVADNKAMVKLEAGKTYDLVVEYFDGGGDSFGRLYWTAPDIDSRDRIELFGEAGKAAAECDLTVAVLGIDKSIEREGQDRYTLELPADQQEFIREIYKINPNTVVVLIAGSSLAINWIDENIPAIVDAWYPGEQGGNAIAEVLFGEYNPAGRLPLTFYNSLDELPAFNDYNVQGRTYQYFTGDPLYEFGYGLSYTNFKYKNLKVTDLGDDINVTFTVQNTGRYDGDEVAQVYVTYPDTGTYMPIKQLRGFDRVNVPKGKSTEVSINIPKKDLRYWNEEYGRFVTPKGQYQIMVGTSSKDIRLNSDFTI